MSGCNSRKSVNFFTHESNVAPIFLLGVQSKTIENLIVLSQMQGEAPFLINHELDAQIGFLAPSWICKRVSNTRILWRLIQKMVLICFCTMGTDYQSLSISISIEECQHVNVECKLPKESWFGTLWLRRLPGLQQLEK